MVRSWFFFSLSFSLFALFVVVVFVGPFSVIVGFYCGRQDFVGEKYEWKNESTFIEWFYSYSSIPSFTFRLCFCSRFVFQF